MIVEFALGKECAEREIHVSGLVVRFSHIKYSEQHFLLVSINSSSERLIEIEKIFVTCGGYDTTYPIVCTLCPTPLSDERTSLCHCQSGDISGIVYGSIVCYFKLPGLRESDIIKGALQYTSR